MTTSMTNMLRLLREDQRFKLEAYQFVRDALTYAQKELGMGCDEPPMTKGAPPPEAHLTGQQLCLAIRAYAQEQYGLMAKLVLKDWGVTSTSDFGEIVYNLIAIDDMKKSESDRREDFDNVYDFDEAFVHSFEIAQPK